MAKNTPNTKNTPKNTPKNAPKADATESTRGQMLYTGLRAEAEKPQKDREAIMKTRTGTAVPRRYHMKKSKQESMRAAFKKTKVFVFPGREGGKYHAGGQALIDLGINKWHPFDAVKAQMQVILSAKMTADGASDAWTAFAKPAVGKKADVASKDVNGKIVQNFKVLQRLTGNHPYGWKLRQLLACIDIKSDSDGMPMFRLNTKHAKVEDVQPLDETKRKGGVKAKPKNAAPKNTPKPKNSKPKATAKGKGGKKGKKPTVVTPLPTADAETVGSGSPADAKG